MRQGPDAGVVILRVWVENGGDSLRIRITTIDSIQRGVEEQRAVTSVDEGLAAVRTWLDHWIAMT